ncbi:glycosyltransferase family 2 protein [Virgibacillus sp. W0181]|uniref:glycosyltransferase family 2 protein n=1 Tax=Virgibacillus sp. W0181 TaxID=3391581 RepID=UPI003F487B87
MKTLTVFTPTYNRAYCLATCYESLKRQTSKDFKWLIIDDGSTDHTKQLVQDWIAEEQFEIIYMWQENQGMHGAHNTAYERIDTELNVCIDSDDYMPDDAVEKIVMFWKKYGSTAVSGIIGFDADTSNHLIGTTLPEQLQTSTLFGLYNTHRVRGDKKLVYRSELTKKYPYPIYKNERYVGLAYKYYMLDLDYEMLLMNEVLCHVEYMPDGSSKNMLHQYRNNPKGFSFYRKQLMTLPFAGTLFQFRQAIHYVSSSLLAKNASFFKETPRKGMTLAAIPIGVALYSYILIKTRTAISFRSSKA